MNCFKSIGLLFLCIGYFAVGQETDSKKVILITMDGLRWQELFSGADPLLVANEQYVGDSIAVKKRFWHDSPKERRAALMPFIWTEVAKMGRIHGNRDLGSKVDLTNKLWFSYPGYNEILTGMADDSRINSNDKVPNPNKTVLEIANADPLYEGKVAAFGSWDVFPYIVNEERSGVPVNAGFELAKGDLTEKEKFLNKLQQRLPSPWGAVRLDAFTHYFAMEHMKKSHPELVYIAYGETDDFAHDGDYEAYLKAANNTDALIKELWEFTQNDPFYKDDTVFILSTDHGRGATDVQTWTDHGSDVIGSGSVWLVLFGKGVAADGEVKKEEQLYSSQIAPTVLRQLRLAKNAGGMKGEPILLGD